MQVIFHSRQPEAVALRDGVERRVRFVLRRVSWRVPRAAIQFSDVNGPRGGVDKRCQVELRTDGGGTVVVTSLAGTWREALDDALARATRFLRRLWQRARDSGRRQRLLSQDPAWDGSAPHPSAPALARWTC